MLSRREFLNGTAAAVTLAAGSGLGQGGRLAAQDRFDQSALLAFYPLGTVTLMHVSDLHAQMTPMFLRPAGVNIGVGADFDRVPHLTGEDFRIRYGVGGRTPMDYALTHHDFVEHARAYGKIGGLDRVATVVNAIRAERPGALLLDGGNSYLGSYGSLGTKGQDMAQVMNALSPDAMTLNAELTLGAAPLKALLTELSPAVLGQNIAGLQEAGLSDLVKPYRIFVQNGVQIAVIGQANPFMHSHDRQRLSPEFSIVIDDQQMQQTVDDVRAQGAQLVVCLSQNGLHVDRKMAQTVKGIDVILSGRTITALPEPMLVEKTHIIASGSHGRFVSRIDFDIRDGKLMELRHKLIPVFSELIGADPKVAGIIAMQRAAFAAQTDHQVGVSEALLYRHGSVTSTWDSLIGDALMAEDDSEIALCPAGLGGRTVLPGGAITRADIYSITTAAHPATYRAEMTGAALKDALEDAAKAAFHPDPYQRHGGDMLRTGGLGFRIDPTKPEGQRLSDLVALRTGAAIEADKTYTVSRWGGAPQGTPEGADIGAVLEAYVSKRGRVSPTAADRIEIIAPG